VGAGVGVGLGDAVAGVATGVFRACEEPAVAGRPAALAEPPLSRAIAEAQAIAASATVDLAARRGLIGSLP